jgi:hypothetical protein
MRLEKKLELGLEQVVESREFALDVTFPDDCKLSTQARATNYQ